MLRPQCPLGSLEPFLLQCKQVGGEQADYRLVPDPRQGGGGADPLGERIASIAPAEA
jgi:hypothetical protein